MCSKQDRFKPDPGFFGGRRKNNLAFHPDAMRTVSFVLQAHQHNRLAGQNSGKLNRRRHGNN